MTLSFIRLLESPIHLESVRDLVLKAAQLHEKTSSLSQIELAGYFSKVVVLLVPRLLEKNLPQEIAVRDFRSQTDPELLFFNGKFLEVIPMRIPGNAFEVSPFQRTLVSTSIDEDVLKEKVLESSNQHITIDDLLIKSPDWEEHNYKYYPGYGQEVPKDWFHTEELNKPSVEVFALDCEFCETESGDQLARISIVDFNRNVVYDKIVKPENVITDYRLRYSGITKGMMDMATTTEAEVRKTLKRLISASDVLVGHSLSFDVSVLKMVHPKIVDTCVIYEHKKKKPYRASLKSLCKTHLGRKIQVGEKGHSSVEDAIACIDLLQLKLSRGMLYGQYPNLQPISYMIEEKTTFIDKSMDEWQIAPCFHDTFTHVPVANDDEAVEKLKGAVEGSKLVFCKLSDFEEASKEQMVKLDRQLYQAWNDLPANSLFIVLGENDVKPEISQLNRQRCQYFRKLRQGEKRSSIAVTDRFGYGHKKKLKSMVEEAKKAVALFAVKKEI
ncbi:hypothetical protein CJI97_001826 [Candidozyma auris]|nr:hypothetical protein CJI97_001826 [[Candida] auris]